jgi:hypothetical protein
MVESPVAGQILRLRKLGEDLGSQSNYWTAIDEELRGEIDEMHQ